MTFVSRNVKRDNGNPEMECVSSAKMWDNSTKMRISLLTIFFSFCCGNCKPVYLSGFYPSVNFLKLK